MAVGVDLICKCKSGDQAAIKDLYEQSAGWMLGVGLRYLSDRNEAMSVVNTSILAALGGLKKYDFNRNESFEAFLKTILIRKLLDYIKKEKRKRWDDELVESQGGVVINNGLSNSRQAELYAMIQKLPIKTATVFNLFAIEGYKHSEIAEMLHISEGTSKWHLNEARTKLQKMVAEWDQIKLAK
ncbi:MAG: RNA polymerase sigma factor [Flavobacteriales bacterium]|nr:RNA polymerase sigma factor [Flavobacteriales bacterium]